MLEIITVIISAISLLIVIINQFRIIKDKEPQLLFNLRSINKVLYLRVKNSGFTKAKNIRIIVNNIYNNYSDEILEDQVFKSPFELSAQEEVQGMIGFLGDTTSKNPFPYIDIIVGYDKPHFIKHVRYERKVFYFASVEEKISVSTDIDLSNIEKSINSINNSIIKNNDIY